MNNILDDINNLKDKINNEIETLRYYKELSYICDNITREIDNYEYDIDNELSLKKYKAFLEVLLENKIGYINNLIISKNNNSVFDNSSVNDFNELKELEDSIDSLLSYINDNFPIIGEEVTKKFNKIKVYYNNQFEYTKDSYKRRFNMDIGINHEPILSIYSDTNSVIKAYVNSLISFKTTYVDSVKVFVDNDIKVKEIFKRAYETLKDPKVIDAVKKLELNYANEINTCMENGSLYTYSNILMIQENMIQNGLHLDKIIDIEKEKNKYYQLISQINFNYDDINMLLETEAYVNNNNLFKDEFYKVLYALIEKEKYLNITYKVEPVLYNKISEKSKIILEKMFLDKLKNLSDEEKEEKVICLKKNGYISVLDNDYEIFFDNSKFNLKTEYIKEEISDNCGNLFSKHINHGIIDTHYNIINRRTGKVVDRIFAIPDGGIVLEDFGDIYRFCGKKIKATGIKKLLYYYDKEGKKIKPFDDKSLITRRVFDLYFVDSPNGKIVTDLDYKTVFEFKNAGTDYEMLIDYTNKYFLILDGAKNNLTLYDCNFKEIKVISVKDILDNDSLKKYSGVYLNSHKVIFNEGIVPLIVYSNSKEYIYYYDVVNMKPIDLFERKYVGSDNIYGYSEGLYNYDDNKNWYGYKNIEGNVVIPPNFLQTRPFFNQCAHVYNDDIHDGFINYSGDFSSFKEIFNYNEKVVKTDLDERRYVALPFDSRYKISTVSARNTYIIGCEDKVIDIGFDNENGKLLKR